MKYKILLLILIILFIYLFNKKSIDKFTSDAVLMPQYICSDTEAESSKLLLGNGNFSSYSQAINKANELNRINKFKGEYEGIYRKPNGKYYFCKNINTVKENGNVFMLNKSLQGDIEIKGHVGVKEHPNTNFFVSNDGTMFVKDRFCLPKDGSNICLSSDDIYRLTHLPLTIPRQKKFCLTKQNRNTGLDEEACINENHLNILNGNATFKMRHMNYVKPKYGRGWVGSEAVVQHGDHDDGNDNLWNGFYINKVPSWFPRQFMLAYEVGSFKNLYKIKPGSGSGKQFLFNVDSYTPGLTPRQLGSYTVTHP